MTSAHEYRANLAMNAIPGPADCIVTRRDKFVTRRFVRVEALAVADSRAERALREHRIALAEMQG
jgi:hypothetical protein